MVAVRLREPAAELAVVWYTVATTLSAKVMGAEIVLFAVPVFVVVINAGPPLVSSKTSVPPGLPAAMAIFAVLVTLNRSEPTVGEIPDRVADVFPGALLKTTAAPAAFGTEGGVQFAVLFQSRVPPAVENVWA